MTLVNPNILKSGTSPWGSLNSEIYTYVLHVTPDVI